jgi:hypothetical protein
MGTPNRLAATWIRSSGRTLTFHNSADRWIDPRVVYRVGTKVRCWSGQRVCAFRRATVTRFSPKERGTQVQ